MPFTYKASIISYKWRAAGFAVACKPSWENTLGEFLIRTAVISSIDLEMALDEEALKLDGRLEIRRREKILYLLAKLWRVLDLVKMLVPVLRRISKQMMVFYLIFGACDPMLRVSRQELRVSVLR